MKSHSLIDERSLAFGQAIARRLAEHPEILHRARLTVQRWLGTCSPGERRALLDWQIALDGPIEHVIALLTNSEEKSVQLRQSNPFAGVLSQEERNMILRKFESYDATPTDLGAERQTTILSRLDQL